MKTQNPLTRLTLLVAVLLTIGVARAHADILPGVRISFAPVGLTIDQTARLNLLNIGVPNGILVSWRFIDANGVTLAQATIVLPMGKIVSVDYRQHGIPLPPQPDLPEESRAEVRAQVDIISAGIPSESIRRSLEIFSNDTGTTTICMSGADL